MALVGTMVLQGGVILLGLSACSTTLEAKPRKLIMMDSFEAREAISVYKKKYRIDVSRFFPEDRVYLETVEGLGYRQFRPALAGDSLFYEELMQKRGYARKEKWDFRVAGSLVNPHDRVLDIGCGEGNFNNYCRNYTGIEFNKSAIAEAVRLGRNVSDRKLHEIPPESFDVVCLFQVLEHVEDPISLLVQSIRCLRKNGRLIVTVPNANSFIGRAPNIELNYPPHHLTWWTEDSLKSTLKSVGILSLNFVNEPIERQHIPEAVMANLAPRGGFFFKDKAWIKLLTKVLRIVVRCTLPRNVRIKSILGATIMVEGIKE